VIISQTAMSGVFGLSVQPVSRD